MRLWLVNPKLLCSKHLSGEHVECHMFLGTIKKRKSVQGYLDKGLFSPLQLKERHDALAVELVRRKKIRKNLITAKHTSPLELSKEDQKYLEYLDLLPRKEIIPEESLIELRRRCPRCRELQERNLICQTL